MAPGLRIVAEEILMCGLKSIPMVGNAFEVVESVKSRHALLAQGERLEEIEQNMSRMDRRLRDLVQEEIRVTLERLGEPALDGRALTDEIRNLRSIQAQGWEPTLFEGLLRNSSHWDELKSRPHHYGRVLDAHALIDRDGIHVLIDAEPLRVLELTPFAFAALLAGQSDGVPRAEIQATTDIWAFPARAIGVSERRPAIVTRQRALTSSVGMTLVRIERGCFGMGSTKEQTDQLLQLYPGSKQEQFDAEQPKHPVEITQPFYLGIHPVTQGQYQAIMGPHECHFRGSDDLPVESVCWLDSIALCNMLSEREGRTPYYHIEGDSVTIVGGNGFRLPTEAEWEYSCRAGSKSSYPFGDDPKKLDECAWYSDNSGGQTHPVGNKAANAWGLYDMLGNVWEWCADLYDENYYARSPVADPPGAPRASHRAVRGGCWGYEAWGCRPANRHRLEPADRNSRLGFRVAASQG
jgi:formylglycine-generating enzyme required for sulfatase activity